MKTENRITYNAAAKLLGCCPRTVRRLVDNKLLTVRRLGHRTVDLDRAQVIKIKPLLAKGKKQLIVRVLLQGGAR